MVCGGTAPFFCLFCNDVEIAFPTNRIRTSHFSLGPQHDNPGTIDKRVRALVLVLQSKS
jgi:hypothetical protein